MNSVSSSGSGAGTADTDALRRVEPLLALVRDTRNDPELQSRMDSDAAGVLAERGLDVPPGIDVRLVRNTPDTFHVVVPPDPNTAIADDELAAVAGGAEPELPSFLDPYLSFDLSPWPTGTGGR